MEFTYKAIRDEVIGQTTRLLTEKEYKQLLSGRMKGIAAFWEESPVAVLLCSRLEDKIWILERISVAEEYRRQGIGTKMMDLLCSYVRSAKVDLLCSFETENEETEMFRFLQSLKGFYLEKEEGFEALISAEEVADIHERFAGKNAKPQLYFEQTKAMQQNFVGELEEEYPAIAWNLKNDQQSFRKDLCCCVADQNGIQAICLMKEYEEELELSFLYAKPGKGVLAAKALMDMASLISGEDAVPIRMSLVNEVSAKILKQMSKNYEVTKQMYTAYCING